MSGMTGRLRRAGVVLRRVWSGQVWPLTRLYGELLRLGLDAELHTHHGRAEVRVRTGTVPAVLRVTVSERAGLFAWREGYHLHPTGDPAGAARRIAAYVQARPARPYRDPS